jgi:putative ABC transport system ATP-binding protein
MFSRNSSQKTVGKKLDSIRSNGHLIELKQVVKTFESDAGLFVALNGIDLQVQAGKFVSIIGKSGSGKSTLLNMVTGIDKPTTGEVLVNGTVVHILNEEEIAVWRGRSIGVIFQFFQLLPTLTAVENVLLAMDYGKVYPVEERPERAMYLLEVVGMVDQAHKLPPTLSGGQQQSIAVARALANDPPILTADEPTGNLDSKTAKLILNLFEDLVDRGKTILMVTHDSALARRAQSTIILADGKIVDRQTNGSGLKVSGKSHARTPV